MKKIKVIREKTGEEVEERMDIIGQNGNDGLHYDENQMELELDNKESGC